jgi:hypothetical protein
MSSSRSTRSIAEWSSRLSANQTRSSTATTQTIRIRTDRQPPFRRTWLDFASRLALWARDTQPKSNHQEIVMPRSTSRAGRWPLALTLTLMTAALAACSDMPTATRAPIGRGALDVQTTAEPVLVEFRVQDTAILDREAGKVHIIGSVTCTAPAKFDIRVSLLKARKQGGTPTVLESGVVPQIDCTTSTATWGIELDSPKSLRYNGTVLVSVRTEAPAAPVEPTGLMTVVQLIRDAV